MKTRKATITAVLLTLLFLPAFFFGQEQPAERGSIELGARGVWGDVYGRPDLPFQPSVNNSKFDEYRDLRSGVFLRGLNGRFEHVLGSNNFLSVQSSNTIYKDQSYLVSFGQYGKYNVQFRWDQTPHTFTGTARTLFTETSPGVFTFPSAVRLALQNTTGSSAIASAVNSLVPSFSFITPSLTRKAGTGSVSYNPSENWNVSASFSREHEVGSRPIGYVMYSSPSASFTSGYGVELPETIDYYTNTVKASTEYGRQDWGVQLAYTGSIFQNDVHELRFDNPFNTVDAAGKPASGLASLYPDNTAHNVAFAGAFELLKHVRVMASITPGWWNQNQAFLPYTSNSVLLAQTQPLPAASPNASRQTLAMNYTVTTRPLKNLQITARYRQYDSNNNTPVRAFTPVEGDAGAPNLAEPEENLPYAFFRKNLDVTGTYFLGKKSAAKLGYTWEGFDRVHRDVAHTGENGIVSSLDLDLRKDLSLRLAYRHSSRTPDGYENESEEVMPATRRFDQAARVRDRGDAMLQYSPLDRLTFSASYGTVQDNYNVTANSMTGTYYGFLDGSGVTPYYSYGLLKDIGYSYDFGVDYAATNAVSVFADYTRETYNTRMVSRQRGMLPGTEIPNTAADNPGNDWTSANHDVIDTWDTGVDLYMSKKVFVTTYYSLSAGKGLNFTRALGSASLFSNPANFLNTLVMNFPETTNRIHEVGAVLKFKLTKNLEPKLQYVFEQFDNQDYQTSPMFQYMGVAHPNATSFYPYLNVFDASAGRYLFLGADSPSYRAHVISASVVYHF